MLPLSRYRDGPIPNHRVTDIVIHRWRVGWLAVRRCARRSADVRCGRGDFVRAAGRSTAAPRPKKLEVFQFRLEVT